MVRSFFLMLLMSLVAINGYAQFYDDEDEIYFYADENDSANRAFVFNFDGKKAVLLATTRLQVKNTLEKD
ncbi:MAG: hypothetical protein K2J66_10880, partial [Muribaculaceae bacterium]|nr:hypothetical protein [Muribaculaceae bacterium]